MIVAFCFFMVFFFVPETFWDRTPRPQKKTRKSAFPSISQIFHHPHHHGEKGTISVGGDGSSDMRKLAIGNAASAAGTAPMTIAERRHKKNQHHVGFAVNNEATDEKDDANSHSVPALADSSGPQDPNDPEKAAVAANTEHSSLPHNPTSHRSTTNAVPAGGPQPTPNVDASTAQHVSKDSEHGDYLTDKHESRALSPSHSTRSEPFTTGLQSTPTAGNPRYTTLLRTQPVKTFRQTLKPWNGRLRHENWLKVAIRPFILFAYPAILWSALVYALSVGWLIVLSESVSSVYANKETYNFHPLGIGLVYISPFVGGVLGTAVAGKVSDIIVRFMSRRNGGVYEPEFRLVMAIPVMIATVIGLMGFGWSAAERDAWIVPTVFFGIISFGCSLGSTTAITFAVDSYRQYAGEALVTLNFSKSKAPIAPPSPSLFNHYLPMSDADTKTGRYLPRPDLLPLLQPLARGRRVEARVRRHRRHPGGVSADDDPDVHLWEEGAHVDCEDEPDGEVLGSVGPYFGSPCVARRGV